MWLGLIVNIPGIVSRPGSTRDFDLVQTGLFTSQRPQQCVLCGLLCESSPMYHPPCIIHHVWSYMKHPSCCISHASLPIMFHISAPMYYTSCIVYHISCIMFHLTGIILSCTITYFIHFVYLLVLSIIQHNAWTIHFLYNMYLCLASQYP